MSLLSVCSGGRRRDLRTSLEDIYVCTDYVCVSMQDSAVVPGSVVLGTEIGHENLSFGSLKKLLKHLRHGMIFGIGKKKEEEKEEEEEAKKPVYDPNNLTKEGLEDLISYPPSTSLPRLSTAPTDSRFPNINQTKNCWQNYVDWLKCERVRGEGDEVCKGFKRVFTILCPSSWVERWEQAREEGISPHADYVERSIRAMEEEQSQ